MARAHYLLRLPFPAIRSPPECPLVARANRIQRIPEFGRDSRVRGVLHHPDALAMFDLPPNLTAKLEVVSLVVDRPGAIGFHENCMLGGCNQLFQRQRLFSWEQTDVRHAYHRQTVPSFSAHRPARSGQTDRVRRLARAQISRKQSIRNNGRALCLDSLVIESKRSQSRPMLLPRIGNYVHQIAAITQCSQLVQGQE